MKAVIWCSRLLLLLSIGGPLFSAPDAQTIESARRQHGCTALREARAISERLKTQPVLFMCYRGRELSHQKLSYVAFGGGQSQEYRSLEAFAAQFGPFDTEASATALALAFTNAEPELIISAKTNFKQKQRPSAGPSVSRSGGGHRVRIYEYSPQQGHCEVPGYYEIIVQTWPDGLKRTITRTKIYEHEDNRQICVD